MPIINIGPPSGYEGYLSRRAAATLLGLNRTTLVEMLKRKRIAPRAA